MSPDGAWLAVSVPGQGTQVVPVAGGPSVRVYASDGLLKWHRDARVVVFSVGRPTERGSSAVPGRAYVLPLSADRMLPEIPANGFASEAEIAKVPGVSVMEFDVAPGPAPGMYAFSREAVQRNLYRIPVP
jgi:hypothetical protein